ncbi:MAG TPA: DUF3515 family protein [Mycobacteriales bacterium]|nr:DUF3515 family protein [Mycobacteriales bacterium]
MPLALGGCGTGAVRLSPPVPPPAVAAACARVVAALPHDLDADLKGRKTSPGSPYTRAWGSPAVTLRCGVDLGKPVSAGVIEWSPPGSPGSQQRCWGSPDLDADPVTLVTRGPQPPVELTVPADVAPEHVLGAVSPLLSAGPCPTPPPGG